MRTWNHENREALIERHLPLARAVARRYDRGREPFEDLFQVASEALVRAAHSYDPDRGYAFASYARPCIAGALKRYFRDYAWAVHVPRQTKDRAVRLRKALARLEVELGRDPYDAELAAAVGASVDEIRETRAAMEAQAALSLDVARSSANHDADDVDAVLGVAAPPDVPDDDIAPILEVLPPRERMIVNLRFRDELTQAEIAKRVGVSQMHVSRLLRLSLERLGALPGIHELAAA